MKSWTRLSDFTFTFHFHALEKEMATHSSVLAWRIPGTGEPGGLSSLGLHRVGHDWSDLAAAASLSSQYFLGSSCYFFFFRPSPGISHFFKNPWLYLMRVVFKNQDLCIQCAHLVSIGLSLLSGPLRGHIHTYMYIYIYIYFYLFMMKAMSSHWYLYFWSSTIRLFRLFSFPDIYLHFLRIRSWLPLSQPPYVWPVFWFG